MTEENQKERHNITALAITEELKERMQMSTDIAERRDKSKTRIAKSYLSQKLARNNKVIADLLVALERLNNKNKKEDNDESSTLQEGGSSKESKSEDIITSVK